MPTAREVAEGRKVGKSKKGKKDKKDGKGGVFDAIVSIIPGAKKIEEAMEKRTGSESMRKKHYPKKK